MMSGSVVDEYLAAKDRGESPQSPSIKLSQAIVDGLEARPYDYSIKEATVPGLRVRVRVSGHKTFEIVKKVGGRTKRGKVCSNGERAYSKGASSVLVAARGLIAEMDSGVTPAAKKAALRAEAAKQAADELTVHVALTDYIEGTDRAANTTSAYTTMRDNHLAPWKNKKLREVAPADVVSLHKVVAKQRGKVAANNCMRLFRATWMANRREQSLGESPTYILSKREKENAHTWTKEIRRNRYIHPEELADWWAATEKLTEVRPGHDGKPVPIYHGDGELGRDYLRFVLFTGMRRREVSGLKWSNINFKRKTLTITENKSSRELTIPLTTSMLEILERRKGNGKPFDLEEPKKVVAKVVEWSGVPFSVHDLRRAFSTYAVAEGVEVSMPVLKSLLNHAAEVKTNTGDVTEGYLANIPEHRKRQALEKIESFILARAGVVSNVVELGGGANEG